ncbi:Transcriptional regulator, RpiR family [Serinicoccus hydrothermalis]|uniref:Transcriptional regulator, RpiR family n=1 Tax=Serinicoccus hydrothermalis TaxID=1758689 RepID=A0A1B1NCR5_9MICO|nr:MurR/RpiR family transcriptional regulator [Serinicoccus hydrothermalis]ANS79222.1 Transcriptional regulator, RpiR family [Serinicoccus hydrothermalis]
MSDAPLPTWVASRLDGHQPGRGVLEVLRSLEQHARRLSYASAAQAGELAGVNAATVVRAAQQLGYPGWPQLRAEVRSRYLSRLSATEVLAEHDGAEGVGVAAVRQDLHNLQDLAGLLDEDQLSRVARILTDARVTLVVGSGSFAAPGLVLAHGAQLIGHDVRLERGGGTVLLNAFSLLRPGDALVVLHLWRTPRDLVQVARMAAGRGIRLVVIGDSARLGIAALADEFVLVPSEGASMFPSLVPSVVIAQALVAALIEADRPAAARAADAAEETWRTFRVFPDELEALPPDVQ